MPSNFSSPSWRNLKRGKRNAMWKEIIIQRLLMIIGEFIICGVQLDIFELELSHFLELHMAL